MCRWGSRLSRRVGGAGREREPGVSPWQGTVPHQPVPGACGVPSALHLRGQTLHPLEETFHALRQTLLTLKQTVRSLGQTLYSLLQILHLLGQPLHPFSQILLPLGHHLGQTLHPLDRTSHPESEPPASETDPPSPGTASPSLLHSPLHPSLSSPLLFLSSGSSVQGPPSTQDVKVVLPVPTPQVSAPKDASRMCDSPGNCQGLVALFP